MKKVTELEFQDAIAEGYTLVDFYADWCGPCKMLSPVLEQLDKEYENKVNIVKVDVDVEHGLARQFGVQSIPTLILFKDGKEIEKTMGFRPKPMFEQMFSSHGITK